MLGFFKAKQKNFSLSLQTKNKIEKELESLDETYEGIYTKTKENELGTYINIIIDKRSLNLESEAKEREKPTHNSNNNLNVNNSYNKENEKDNNPLPDYINFVIILDYSFPKNPPKILSKTNFSFPSLMDGRDLFNEICNEWNPNMRLVDIINKLPDFIVRVRTSKVFNFYGCYHMGSLYDLKNFNNMLVNTFTCSLDNETLNKQRKNSKENITHKSGDTECSLVLTDDSIILFEINESNSNIGKLIFWSTLYSIIDAQVNKLQKFIMLRLFNDESNQEISLKIKIDNILFFREALMKRMNSLQVRCESKKIIKGQTIEKRFTDKDVLKMNIVEVVENYKIFNEKIEHNELSYYNVTTFFNLTQKAVEYYSARNDANHIIYLNAMKNIFGREDIQKILHGEN